MSTQQQQQLQMHSKQKKRSTSDGGKAQKKRHQRVYRGVRSRNQGRWVSEIRMPDNRGRIWLGSYDSACKAALAYDFAAFCLRGRGSQLNFPNSLPYRALELGIPTSPRSIQAAASQFAEKHSSSSSGFGVGSEPVAAVERQKMLVAATISEGCFIGSSNDDDNGMDFEATDNGSRAQLPALDLDFGVLDSLSHFLASHSHTNWWLD